MDASGVCQFFLIILCVSELCCYCCCCACRSFSSSHSSLYLPVGQTSKLNSTIEELFHVLPSVPTYLLTIKPARHRCSICCRNILSAHHFPGFQYTATTSTNNMITRRRLRLCFAKDSLVHLFIIGFCALVLWKCRYLVQLLFETGSRTTFSPFDLRPDAEQLVPKIIHQTYANTSIPHGWRKAQRTLLKLHPEYEYKVSQYARKHTYCFPLDGSNDRTN